VLTTNASRKKPQISLATGLLLIAFLLLYVLVFVVRLPKLFFAGQTLLQIQAGVYGVCVIAGLFIFRRDLISGLTSWRSSAISNMLWLVGAFVASTIMVSIAAYPAYAMGFEDVSNADSVLLMIKALGKPLAVLIIGLCGPMTEELLYRAFLIGRAKAKFPLWICVILSSLLFAGMHLSRHAPQRLILIEFSGYPPAFRAGPDIGHCVRRDGQYYPAFAYAHHEQYDRNPALRRVLEECPGDRRQLSSF
jgi:membrane protease YdiL (CAAX protease family)